MYPATTITRLPLARGVSFVQSSTWIVASLLAVSSIAGLAFGPHGWYDRDAALFPALLSQDAVALLMGVPLLAVSAWLASRGSTRAFVCWMGGLFYVAYFWYFYVVGIRFTPLLPIHIVLVSMGMYGVLYLFFALDAADLKARFDASTPVRLVGAFLMATALGFAALWMTTIVSAAAAGRELDGVTRVVIAIDGVVLLPLTFFGGLWLWRREPLGYALGGLLLVKIVATFLTLVVTTLVAARAGLSAAPVETIAYTVGLVVAAVLLVTYLRHLHDDAGLLRDLDRPDPSRRIDRLSPTILEVFSLARGQETQAGRQAAARARW
jgi:hypothetical protein